MKATWKQPRECAMPVHVHNSISRTKSELSPSGSNTLKWYSCGPTVYDASHMGHARSYISFDILRRVLNDYRHLNVLYMMNITDLDDKIILKARKQHLLAMYKNNAGNTGPAVLTDARLAMEYHDHKMKELGEEEQDKRSVMQRAKDAVSAGITSLEEHLAKGENGDQQMTDLLSGLAGDVLASWLDSRDGRTVTDHAIFAACSQFWEQAYHRDMAALGIREADVLTRVTEYVPEIVSYVEKIIERGLAYEAEGSVYFDVQAFVKSGGSYAKLVPEAVGDSSALADGEGELGAKLVGKRAPQDFALWKASKPGEPAWDSPWGKGRPGWHIECSVMASDVLGSQLDIHTGGVDLKFPHHDNEMAQAEAHYGCSEWVRYFLHSGHLVIEGRKMSKSLKNFITIKEALSTYTARQVRLMFLLHGWRDTLDYSENTMREALSTEKTINEFFLNIKAVLHTNPANVFSKFSKRDNELNAALRAAKAAVHTALSDNMDTPSAITAIRGLISNTNVYLSECESNKERVQAPLVHQIGRFITETLDTLGLNDGASITTSEDAGPTPCLPAIGLEAAGGGTSALESALMGPLLEYARLRDAVRRQALTVKDKRLLSLCDHVRDEMLPPLGVRLEDKEQGAVVKLVDAEQLMEEKRREKEREEAKRKAKEAARARKAEQEAAKLAKMRVKPSEMFLDSEYGEFSQFDERGVPTHDKEGEPLAKAAKKKLEKAYAAQVKLHDKWLKMQEQ